VGVGVGLGVGVGEGVGVGVAVGLGGAVGVGVGVAVGVGVGVPVSTIRDGGVADSRLPKLSAVALVVVSARLIGPSPVTSGVTSISYQVPATTGPDELVAAECAGEFE
jgi:hypothetical protein